MQSSLGNPPVFVILLNIAGEVSKGIKGYYVIEPKCPARGVNHLKNYSFSLSLSEYTWFVFAK